MRIKGCLLTIVTQILLIFSSNTIAQERLQPVSPVAFGLEKTKSGESGSYRLRPEDTIELAVYREDDLATKTKLDKDGTVVLPLIGEVRLGGLTVKQARKLVSDLYEADYLVAPQVTLTYTARDADSSGTFSVLGSVASPGVFPLPKGKDKITIREAVAMAGGMTRYASDSKVKVRRRIADADKIFEVNLRKMNDDARVESFYILAGDSINVPERVF